MFETLSFKCVTGSINPLPYSIVLAPLPYWLCWKLVGHFLKDEDYLLKAAITAVLVFVIKFGLWLWIYEESMKNDVVQFIIEMFTSWIFVGDYYLLQFFPIRAAERMGPTVILFATTSVLFFSVAVWIFRNKNGKEK